MSTSSLSTSQKLWLLNIAIILSVLLGVFTSYELKKGAVLHELNSLHLKHNNIYHKNFVFFKAQQNNDLSILKQNIHDIRAQPIGCLNEIGWVEELFLKMISTDQAIQICRNDINVANETLRSISDFETKLITRSELEIKLAESIDMFQENSSQFEHLVSDSVSKMFQFILVVVIVKGLLVVAFGAFLSRSVSRDYKQIKAAEQSAREANQELEEFAYRTSHDLRAPLISSIKLIEVSNTFIDEGDKKETKNVLNLAADSLKKLEVLVGDILTLTKARHMEEKESTIDVSLIVDESLDKIKKLDGADKIDVVREFDHLGDLIAKESRFKLIVENLISNAFKYADFDKDSPFVKIGSCQTKTDFEFSVEDNGIGIPRDSKDQLFKMFKRFHTKVSFGSGLGLYMIKKSADALGANIVYEDTGNGSRFTLKIPKEELKGI